MDCGKSPARSTIAHSYNDTGSLVFLTPVQFVDGAFMEHEPTGPLRMRVETEKWPLVAPFRMTGQTLDAAEVLVVVLENDDFAGRGEAAGVDYRNETTASMRNQLEAVRAKVERGLTARSLQQLLPLGGARNALDCALWDFEASASGQPAWRLAGLHKPPQSLVTTFTCGADTPEKMAAAARAYRGVRAIKIKLTGEASDGDRVRAVREAQPSAWLGVDANQGFTRHSLTHLMPIMVESKVELIEQPYPVGHEALLDGFDSPIAIAADESAQSLRDIPDLVGRFGVVNIKLDKSGGLTESLAMARAARQYGLEAMIGNMIGTSLAMAPAFLVGQLCTVVDLDGPILLKSDRSIRAQYEDGYITCPEALWGYSHKIGGK